MFLLRWALSELQTGHTSRLKVLRLDGVIERTLTSCWPNQVQFSRGSKHSIDEWSGCREWCPRDVWSSTLKTNFRSVCLSTIHTAPASLSIGFLLSVSSDMSLSFLAPVAGLPTKRGWCEKHKIFKEVTSKRAPGGELDHVPFPSRWQDRCRGHHLPSRPENSLLSVTFRQNRFNFRIMEWDVL